MPARSTSGRATRLATADGVVLVAAGLAGALALAALARLLIYGFDYAWMPSTDQWRIVDRMTAGGWLRFVFSEHNGHRIALPNLAILADYRFFEWQNAFAYWFGAALSALALVAIFLLLRVRDLAVTVSLFALLVSLYTLPVNWRNYVDATQSVAVHGYFLFTIAAVLSIREGTQRRRAGYVWLGAGLGLLSALSFSYGLLVPFLGVPALLRMRRWASAALLFALATGYAVWELLPQLARFVSGGASGGSILDFLVGFAVSILSTLVLAVRDHVPYDLVVLGVPVLPLVGLSTVLLVAALAILVLRTSGASAVAPWAGLALVALGSSAMIFAGRSVGNSLIDTVGFAAAPRYFVVSYLWILAMLGLLARALVPAPLTVRRLCALAALALAAFLATQTIRSTSGFETRYVRSWFGNYAGALMLSLSGGEHAYMDANRGAVREARLRVTERIAWQRKGVFALEEADYIGAPTATLNGGAPVPQCVGTAAPGARLEGWAGDPAVVEIRGGALPEPDHLFGGTALLSDASGGTIAYAGATGLYWPPILADRDAHFAGFVFFVPETDPALAGRTVYLRPDGETPFCRLTVSAP